MIWTALSVVALLTTRNVHVICFAVLAIAHCAFGVIKQTRPRYLEAGDHYLAAVTQLIAALGSM